MARTIIRKKVASARTGLSGVSLWRLENANQFPHRVQLSEHSVGYYEDEVDDWIHSRIRAAGRVSGRPIGSGRLRGPT